MELEKQEGSWREGEGAEMVIGCSHVAELLS